MKEKTQLTTQQVCLLLECLLVVVIFLGGEKWLGILVLNKGWRRIGRGCFTWYSRVQTTTVFDLYGAIIIWEG